MVRVEGKGKNLVVRAKGKVRGSRVRWRVGLLGPCLVGGVGGRTRVGYRDPSGQTSQMSMYVDRYMIITKVGWVLRYGDGRKADY